MPRKNTFLGGGLSFRDLTKLVGNDPPDRPGFEGEKHAIMLDGPQKGTIASYTGPGTNVKARLARGDPGINDLDRAAKKHDIAYMNTNALPINKREKMGLIHAADKSFIEEANLSSDAPLTAKVAANAMKLKMGAEKLGLLPPTIFSGGGGMEELLYSVVSPAYNLQIEAGKHGGLHSSVIPYLVGEDKKIINKILSMSQPKQIEFMTKAQL